MKYLNIIYVLFFASFTIQLLYKLYFNSRLLFLKENKNDNNLDISVIICARNEIKNLKKNLKKILNQQYKNFEVVVVNDRSWDNSKEYLDELKEKYENLKIVNIPDNQTDHFGKKLAITLGIKAAKYSKFLFTDADCYPKSEFWIKEMSKGFNNEKQIVLGAGIYKKDIGLLNRIIRFDTAFIATNYLSFAKANIPYMGVGRNLGYTEDVYYLNEGFKSHYHIGSGDDDLFVNQAAKKNNTEIIFTKNSLTVSSAKKTWKHWLFQKRRHHTTNFKYKFRDKTLLGLQYLSSLTFYIFLILSVYIQPSKIEILVCFLTNYFVTIIILYKPFKVLMCKDLLWVHPIYEIILLFCRPMFQIKKKNII